MIYSARTIAGDVVFEGKGLHTGMPVRMVVRPGTAGIAFTLGSERVLAIPENVTDTRRSTRLGSVGTIEHLMAAFAGLEITDAEVELNAPEVPGMDGSAKLYVEGFLGAGFIDGEERQVPDLYRRIFLAEDNISISIGKGAGHGRYVYDLGERWPGAQVYESESVTAVFATEIAPARTFALTEEVPHLKRLGLGQGLDETSAVIVGPAGYENEVRFPDELARHKLLDLMGDLYLAGVPLRALNFVGERSGHRTHVQAAAMLRSAAS
jgi:UDP-3-O-[3-hydroxymyristoyl] N-acetylglucosamine deacetylase